MQKSESVAESPVIAGNTSLYVRDYCKDVFTTVKTVDVEELSH